MTGAAPEQPVSQAWPDAMVAAALLAVDPAGLGGAVVRACPGPARDRWLEILRALLPAGTPLRKLPSHISDDRLLGGLDLSATLRAGRPIAERGVLAEADGGVVVAPMAERMSAGLAARLGAVLDTGMVAAEREGLSILSRARLGMVVLDEGLSEEERPPPGLTDRLAFRLLLESVPASEAVMPAAPPDTASARTRLASIVVPDEILTALARAADALGVSSPRALLLAMRAARASAAVAGRACTNEDDAATAGRLVLAPRAVRIPAPPPEQQAEGGDPEPQTQQSEPPSTSAEDSQPQETSSGPLDDLVLQAAAAALPPGLLARAALQARGRSPDAAGKAGDLKLSPRRGRPAGICRGDPRTGKRLSLVATLRNAAPWQSVRRKSGRDDRRIVVHADDFRVRRLKHPTETTAIFVVDASGSSALHRLAEAKGAVEMLLSECYVRRDRVALVSFRGKGADLLLPPTRSLVRAKRCLAGLPGGGGTPLAAAIDAALSLADGLRRKGQTPVIVLLTDGRANIARDGAPGRVQAGADALAACRLVRAAGLRALLVDTSPKPQDTARRIAGEMGAAYLPLPYAGSAALSAAVRTTLDVTAAGAARP